MKEQPKFSDALVWPIDTPAILKNRRAIKKELLSQKEALPLKVAILGGATSVEVKNMLELFLLKYGFQPSFYESGYNRFYEEAMSEVSALWQFKPDVVFIDTTWRNVAHFPELLQNDEEVEDRLTQEMSRFKAIWERIGRDLGALVIQNNFDLPNLRVLGNLDGSRSFGRTNFLGRLNHEFAKYAERNPRFLINDILYLSAKVGLDNWYDPAYWYNFHMALSPVATIRVAENVANIMKAAYGKAKKCLVLDLDNTLWGGVIGDDGVEKLLLGRDNPVGEAFSDFQAYVKGLQERGVILAVCSKNNPEIARKGFSHPDSLLKLEDFSAFRANWDPKPGNIREIAAELNIGLDSMVFVDDSPAERAFVAEELPQVAVPEVGSDVAYFAQAIEDGLYFSLDKILKDDLARSTYYAANAQRAAAVVQHENYDQFLQSLEMRAEIDLFQPVYMERITQLINKTNQFNLTTKRCSAADVYAAAEDPACINLYGKLQDRFGDNGLVSVLMARMAGDAVEIPVWVMSCRVFNRELEYAMFDILVEECVRRGISEIRGFYIPSQKNGVVADLYARLGFGLVPEESGEKQTWTFAINVERENRSRFIQRTRYREQAQELQREVLSMEAPK